MKQIFLFIAILIGFSATAQWSVDKDYDFIINDNQSAYFINGNAKDVIGEGDSTLTKTIFINTHNPVQCDVYVALDSISAGAAINIYFKGKQFPDDDYTVIDTVIYAMTADTSFTFSETTAQKYRYWQVAIEAPSDTIETKLQKAYFKFWK